MRHVVIHIGANKTASTTLQRALFRRHPGIHYMGEDAEGYDGYASIVNSMVNDDDLYFPMDECTALFRRHLAEEPDRTLVYSNEDVMTSRVPTVCARRLHSLLPGAEVLLVIRNQFSAIPSFYANHGAFLKPAPPSYFRRHVSFDDWMQYQLMFPKYGAIASFLYDKLLSVYATLFGEDHVHVLLFEEFVMDRPGFVRKLAGILRIDPEETAQLLHASHERKRLTGRMLAYNRFRTRLLWGISLSRWLPFGNVAARMLEQFLSGGPAASVAMSDEIRQKVFAFYGEDNARLAARYGLPLTAYGYPVKEQ